MTPPTAPLQFLQAFRQKLLSVFPMRADALFELVDALLLTVDPRSPVELSASPAFRRRFSMVYDALRQGQIDPAAARELLAEAEPAEAMTVAGYAVYATDGTVHPRPDADTLPDRGQVYSTSQGRTVPGHQYNWLGRIVAHGRSRFAPRGVERVATRPPPAARREVPPGRPTTPGTPSHLPVAHGQRAGQCLGDVALQNPAGAGRHAAPGRGSAGRRSTEVQASALAVLERAE